MFLQIFPLRLARDLEYARNIANHIIVLVSRSLHRKIHMRCRIDQVMLIGMRSPTRNHCRTTIGPALAMQLSLLDPSH